MKLLSLREIRGAHQKALAQGGLSGESTDRPLDAVLGRVEIAHGYGLIPDVITLAAWYGYAIAQGHPFNDGNKRTGWLALRLCLEINEIEFVPDEDSAVEWMVNIAKGEMELDRFVQELRGVIETPVSDAEAL